MRLFVAVEWSGQIRSRLFALGGRLSDLGSVKAVEEENIHLTLRFLGEVDAARVDEVVAALGTVRHRRFMASVRGLGAFPKISRPNVIWAGIGVGSEDLVALQGKIDDALIHLGFPPEGKFHPHLTLARVKGPLDNENLRRLIVSNESETFGESEVREFSLIGSTLTPSGPIYSKVRGFALFNGE